MTDHVLKILMIGPVPPPVGGARVLFKSTVDYMDDLDEIEQTVLPLWSLNDHRIQKILIAFRLFFQVLFRGFRYDVISFWTSRNGMLYFGPFLRLISALTGTPLVIRLFGIGSSRLDTELNALERWLTRYIYKSLDLVLVETQAAVDQIKIDYPSARIALHKNYRMIPEQEVVPHQRCHRFIFLGKVREDKGILDIIEAAESMAVEDLVVDVYGPFEGGLSEETFANCQKVRYCGILSPDQVVDVISTYHALLLPTYYAGEGHPGAILEAYASGLPVIVSKRQTLMEIVDDSSGVLVPAQDPARLKEAMTRLVTDPDLYQRLANGAIKKRQEFGLPKGVEHFISYCRDLKTNVNDIK